MMFGLVFKYVTTIMNSYDILRWLLNMLWEQKGTPPFEKGGWGHSRQAKLKKADFN
jgi:hypothetical protein